MQFWQTSSDKIKKIARMQKIPLGYSPINFYPTHSLTKKGSMVMTFFFFTIYYFSYIKAIWIELCINEIALLCKSSLGGEMVKNLPAMRETWVQSMGWEDPLEKEKATHSSVLAWRIPETEEPGGLQSPWRSQRVRHNWVMHTYLYSATYFFRLIHVAVIFISVNAGQ